MIRRQNRMKTSQIDAAMEMLRSKGRNGDTELAHVNPREKAILKALGGAGSRNPRTGLREYYEAGVDVGGGDQSPAAQGDLGLGTGPSFGNESGQGGGQIADLSQQDQEAIGRGGLIAGQNEVALSGLGAVGRGMGRALDSGDFAPGAGLFSLVGAGMAELGRQARSAYGPDFVADPTFEGGRQREAFMGGPDFPGNRAGGGDSLAMALGAIPVSAPTPRYLRGGEMAAPQEISSFIGPGMTDLQQRALISTYGTQGVNSAFRTDPVRRYYANLLSRGLISDRGTPVQNPYVLPIEQQYASMVLGRPMTNPSDAAAAYESIRELL
jgi:hypothetical protein